MCGTYYHGILIHVYHNYKFKTRQSEIWQIPRPPHASAWQRSPHFFRDVISLLARIIILLIDTATQEVPMKNI